MQKLSDFELVTFLQQLKVLLSDDGSLPTALSDIQEHTQSDILKKHLKQAVSGLQSGKSLHDSLFPENHPFPEQIALTFKEMPAQNQDMVATVKNLEDSYKTRMFLVNTPAVKMGKFALSMVVLFFIFVLVFVVPSMSEMFQGMGRKFIPPTTRSVLVLSELFINYWFVMIPLSLVGSYYAGLKIFSADEDIHDTYLAFSLLAGQIRNGASIEQALTWAHNSVGKGVVSKNLKSALISLQNGESFSASIKKTGLFEPFVANIIAAGEKKGSLEQALTETASYYSVEREIKGKYASIIIILLTILAVAYLVIAMYMPIFQMGTY